MSHFDDDVTVILFQPEPGKPMEVMPAPDLSRNIAIKKLDIQKIGVNPLIDPFSWLIVCLSCIESIPWLDDPLSLREQMEREIRKGERKLNEMEIDRPSILVIRYCICAAIDEAVCSQEWGANSDWNKQSLLSEFHNETSGGDKFYVILERLKQDPKRYRYVIEFLFLLLQLGFKGRYAREARGDEKITEIADVIYRLIRDDRLAEQENIQLSNLKAAILKRPLKKVISPKFVIGLTAALSVAMYAATYLIINIQYSKLLAIISS